MDHVYPYPTNSMQSAEAPRPRPKNLPRNLLHFSPRLPSIPTPPGNIGAFKDMELTSLNLNGCRNLTGVFGLRWGMVGGVKIGNRCCLRASPKEWSRNFLQSHHYHMHLPPLDFKATLTPSRTTPSHR